MHHHFHNFLPFTIILASICGLIQIYLTVQVIKLRRSFKTPIGIIKETVYDRKNGALTNFIANTPIVLILYALAENNRANCGLLFFFGGLFILARLVHIYSLYHYESKTKRFNLRIFGMGGTFTVIFALILINLYTIIYSICIYARN